MTSLVDLLFPLFSGVITVLSLIVLVNDWGKTKWQGRFQEQVGAALKRNALTYQDLQHISERWRQDRKSVSRTLRTLLSEAISGENKELEEKAQSLRSLLNEHSAREPYAELPENISLQLAVIERELVSKPELVSQLASSLSALYARNQRDLDRQTKFALWGFIIGIAGLLASLPSLYSLFKT